MEDFLTHTILCIRKCTYTSKILTDEKFPHPVFQMHIIILDPALTNNAHTYTLEKS